MSYIHFSIVPGKVPTVAQLLRVESRMGYNLFDGKLFALQSANGVKTVILIGSAGNGGSGDTHTRAHSMISELDHVPVEPNDEGKIPQADPLTGKWKLVPMPADGKDGKDGVDGITPVKGIDYFDGDSGVDGISAYVYIAYASDNTGTGWSLTPSGLLKYIALIQSDTELTPLASDFSAASWIKYIGDDGEAAAPDTFDVYINFLDVTPFVYNCPYAVRFTSQVSEGTDATISPPLTTALSQFQKMTVTPTQVGLIILTGELL